MTLPEPRPALGGPGGSMGARICASGVNPPVLDGQGVRKAFFCDLPKEILTKIAADSLFAADPVVFALMNQLAKYCASAAKDVPAFDLTRRGRRGALVTDLLDMLAMTVVQRLHSLTFLDLTGNYLGFKGSVALARALKGKKVVALNLSCTQIGCSGTAALATTMPYLSLTRLDLIGKCIREEGARALANALQGSTLTLLNLGGNFIGGGGAGQGGFETPDPQPRVQRHP